MSTALAVIEKFEVPALSSEMAQAYAEEMEGLQVSFDRVKIPSGGQLAFEVPGDDPDNPEVVKELVGVIVDHHPVNALWAEKYSGQNNPPDCSALDGKTGITSGGERRACNSCPYNAWGSDTNGRGKACKNMHRVYLLREGDSFPLLLTLPPTSIKNFADYIAKRIIAKGRRSYQVVTRISLKKATSGDGITYSQAQFSLAGILPQETARKLEEYSKSIRATTRSFGLTTEDYQQEAEAGTTAEDDLPF